MGVELYRVDYIVLRDFDEVIRSSFVYATSATSANDWIRRYWKHKHCRDISLKKTQVVVPMVGKIIATTWIQS